MGTAAAAATLAGCTGGNEDGDADTTTTTTTSSDSTSNDDESSDNTGGTLTYLRGSTSGTLDPQQGENTEDAKVHNQIFDTMVEIEPGTAKLQAGLATKWEVSDDGTTVRFTLRDGVKFHNGDTLTASDVVATYRRYNDPEYEYFLGEDYASGAGFMFTAVADVTADGDDTVVIDLERPFAPVLNNMAQYHAGVFPESAIKAAGDEQQTLGEEPVGTGAFQLDTWNRSNQTIRLSAFDDWWNDGPHVDEVVFKVVGSNTTRAQTLDSGGADIIDGVGSQAIEQVKASDNANLLQKPGLNFGFMSLNMTEVEAFRDERVRAAFNYALDTETIVQNLFGNLASVASQSLAPSMVGYNDDLDPWGHDPEKAKQLLEEAGYGDGLELELATFKNARPYIPQPIQLANAIKSYLSEVGVEVEIKQMPFSPYLEYTIGNMNHEIGLLGWSSTSGSSNDLTYPLFHPGVDIEEVPDGQDWVSKEKIMDERNTWTVTGWANTEYMQLIEDAQKSYESGERGEKYRQAMKILHDSPCDVMLTHASVRTAIHNRVENYTLSVVKGPFLHQVRLSE